MKLLEDHQTMPSLHRTTVVAIVTDICEAVGVRADLSNLPDGQVPVIHRQNGRPLDWITYAAGSVGRKPVVGEGTVTFEECPVQPVAVPRYEYCKSCGCEGFHLTEGLCDGCHEARR